MKELAIVINKEEVYEEVAQTTSYSGAKMENDEKAYDRIFTTEADRSQLERFWNESCAAVCEALKEFVRSEQNTGDSFNMELSLSSAFESALEPAIRKELFSFFVSSIVSKWYMFTNKKEASDFMGMAASHLEGVKRKVYWRKRPKRPSRRPIADIVAPITGGDLQGIE